MGKRLDKISEYSKKWGYIGALIIALFLLGDKYIDYISMKGKYDNLQIQRMDLIKENDNLRIENMNMKDSLNEFREKINNYESRIVDLNEYECKEVLENNFIICVYFISKDEERVSYEIYSVDGWFEYVGSSKNKIRGDDSVEKHNMNLQETMVIKLGEVYYIARLLNIDFNNKKVKFSLCESTIEPER